MTSKRIIGLPLVAFIAGLIGLVILVGLVVSGLSLGWFGGGGGARPTGTGIPNPTPTPSPTNTGTASPSPVPTPNPTPTISLSHFASLDAFKNAYVSAGGRCDNWDPSNPVTAALASGTCTAGYSVLMLTADAQSALMLAASIPDDTGDQVAYGDNWVLNAVDSPQVVTALGGVLLHN